MAMTDRPLGVIGAGAMGSAVARGWGDAVLVTDAGSGRADALAAEVGGERVATNRELAERAGLVVLCHEPPRLEAVAREVDGRARAVVSVLSGVSLARLEHAYPGTPSFRCAVNLAVAVRAGVVCYAGANGAGAELEEEVASALGRLGRVLSVDERAVPAAAAVASPATVALFVEAEVEAAVRAGLAADAAAEIAVQALAGTAGLLREQRFDAAGLQRAVASPGGPTGYALAALEAGGLRGVVGAAVDAFVARFPPS